MTISVDPGLTQLVDRWIGWVSELSLAELRDTGSPPFASVANGAAGNAYALWHVAMRRGDRSLLEQARRWSLLAQRAARQPHGLRGNRRWQFAGSAGLGMAGLHAVHALISHALDRPRDRDRAITAFIAASTPRRFRPEVTAGGSGVLMMALSLHRHTLAPTIRGFGDALVRRIIDAGPPWTAGLALAHGDAGVQHALISWAHAGATVLPPSVLASVALPAVERVTQQAPAGFARSQCSGLAGFVQLWVAAYELTSDPVWLDGARAGALELVRDSTPCAGGVCCGAAGFAYALLAVARIDPHTDWRSDGGAFARRALADDSLVNGLYFGLPGLVCLVSDLAHAGPIHTPLLGA